MTVSKTGPGTLTVRHLRGAGLRIDSGAVQVIPGGGDAATSLLDSLAFAGSEGSWDGLLDLTDGSLVVRGADLGLLTDQVIDGLDGSGGITSSLADARHGVGLIPNGTPGDPVYTDFEGITSLTGGEALVRFTLFGDADPRHRRRNSVEAARPAQLECSAGRLRVQVATETVGSSACPWARRGGAFVSAIVRCGPS